LWLAAILPAGAQTGWESLYSTEALSKEKPRLEERVNELFRRLNTLFSAAEKSAFARVEFEVPLRDPTGNPLNFFAHGTVRAPRVTMPVQSLLFVEDLSTAYAWLHLNGYSLETVDEYITLLKYKTPADFPSRRYPPPLTALGIPRDASGDRRVDELSLRFRNSAYAFILTHELGHVLLQHPGYRGISMAQARAHEAAADRFALDVMQRDGAIPMGAVLFFQAQAYITPNLGQFRAVGKSLQDWESAVKQAMTHPLTADRIQAIALHLDDAAATWPRQADRPTVRFVAVQLAQIAEILQDADLQQCMAVAAARADPQRLQPRRPSNARQFLEQCVKR